MNDGASVIVVGWTPDEFGEVALHRGVEEARLRAGRVVVVNATRGDALVDDRFADEEQLGGLTAELASSGIEVEVRRSGAPPWASCSWEASRSASCSVRTAPCWR